MTVGSSFSGIGGFDLGLERAGMQVRWQVENNGWCQRVLAKHWPTVPRYGDITGVDWAGVEPVDLICGGFPCQPFSVAGKRQGANDARNMWPEYRRCLETLKPRWVLGENVLGVKSYLEAVVLPDLEALGYETTVLGIPACAIGAPHRRERLWIVAHTTSQQSISRNHQRKPGETSKSQQIQFRGSNCGRAGGAWLPEPDVGRVVDGVPLELDFTRRITRWCDEQSDNSQKKPTRNVLVGKLLRAMWEYQELATASRELYVRKLQDSVPEVPLFYPYDRWLLGARIKENQGLCDLWKAFYSKPLQETQDMQFKLLERAWAEKLQKTVGSRIDRLRGLGNAVVPQIVEWIGRAIMEVENRKYGQASPSA